MRLPGVPTHPRLPRSRCGSPSPALAGKPDRLFASTDTDQGRDGNVFHVQSVLNCEGFFPPIYFQLPTLN